MASDPAAPWPISSTRMPAHAPDNLIPPRSRSDSALTLSCLTMIEPGGTIEVLRRRSASGARPTSRRAGGTNSGRPHGDLVEYLRAWGGTLRDGGLATPHWPLEWGGGYSVPEQVVIAEELARGDVPRNALFHVANFNVAPALLHHATDEQKDRYLNGIRNGEVWCQGFSEPDAGSDLAGLPDQCRARRRAWYVITGQKVWTSSATTPTGASSLVRTDPEARSTGHQLPDRRHEDTGHRGATAIPSGVRPGRLQRGLLRRRRRAGGQPPRRREPGLGRRPGHARPGAGGRHPRDDRAPPLPRHRGRRGRGRGVAPRRRARGPGRRRRARATRGPLRRGPRLSPPPQPGP